MDIGDKELVGVGSALFGWLGGVWSVARKITTFERDTTTTLQNHEKQLAEHSEEIAKLRNDHDEDLNAVREFFQTSAGGQKFMTFPDHDLICERNSKTMITEMRHITAAVQALTAQSVETGREIGKMRVDIEVIKAEIRKS
jgi:hypothetical protein